MQDEEAAVPEQGARHQSQLEAPGIPLGEAINGGGKVEHLDAIQAEGDQEHGGLVRASA